MISGRGVDTGQQGLPVSPDGLLSSEKGLETEPMTSRPLAWQGHCLPLPYIWCPVAKERDVCDAWHPRGAGLRGQGPQLPSEAFPGQLGRVGAGQPMVSMWRPAGPVPWRQEAVEVRTSELGLAASLCSLALPLPLPEPWKGSSSVSMPQFPREAGMRTMSVPCHGG